MLSFCRTRTYLQRYVTLNLNPVKYLSSFSTSTAAQQSQTQSQTPPTTQSPIKLVQTCLDENRNPKQRGINRENLSEKFQLNDEIIEGGFKLSRISPLPHYECTAYQFEHLRTGANWIHLDTEDSNNAFAIALRTIPADSNGVAHILEHTTLCGSQNFPVRDPFFHMLKRSLNTFMNAMTAADWTLYPFSTQNEQDFHNLMKVYCDSVFFPLLNKLDFMQEGHRFEFVDNELKFKGVVYNEMKGVMSDSSDILNYEVQNALFCDNLYQHNSGGDPKHIPSLTHAQLRAFHAQYYHPSNAYFYSYGDLCPSLHEINELVLRHFERIDLSAVERDLSTLQPSFAAPKSMDSVCPSDVLISDPYSQQKVCMSWICNNVSEIEDTFGLTVLSQLLLAGPSSPFYQSLIKPNLGHGYISNAGYSMHTLQGQFSIGLNNILEEDIEKVEQLILSTMQKCADTGFKADRIEAVLHQFEIDQKHKSGTFSLNLLYRMISLMTHRSFNDGMDPTQSLEINQLIETMRQKVLGEHPTDPHYFANLIDKYFINNAHRLTFVMRPDAQYMEKKENEEKLQLQTIESSLNEVSKNDINANAEALRINQETEQDADILPTLYVDDIPLVSPDPITVEEAPHAYSIYNEYTDDTLQVPTQVLYSKQLTNEIAYYKLLYDMKPLFATASSTGARIEDSDFNLLLPLYTDCLTAMGAADMNYEQLSDKIESTTGEVSAQLECLTPLLNLWSEGEAKDANAGAAADTDRLKYYLEVHSYCLNRNLTNMMNLLEDILIHPNFEFYDRLESLIKDKIQSDVSSVIESGHTYAILNAASQYGNVLPSARVNEKLSGISQIKFMGILMKALQSQRYPTIKELITIFNQISNQLFKQQGPIRSLLIADENILLNNSNAAAADVGADELSLTESIMAPFTPTDYFNHPSVYRPSHDNVDPSTFPKPVFAQKAQAGYAVLNSLFSQSKSFADEKKKDADGNPILQPKGMVQLRNYFSVPSQVNYVACVIPTVSYTHPDCAALRVAAKLLSLNYLHQEIREKNGAYAGGAVQNKNLFAFFSYRDPESLVTCDTFKNSIFDYLLDSNPNTISDRDVDEALLSLFSSLDSPRSPSEKGTQEFLQDIDEGMREAHRQQLLNVNKQQIQAVVEKYLATAFNNNEAAYSIVGKQDMSASEKESLENRGFKITHLG